MHVLITGGAGFIGSHVADILLGDGHRVRALDNLEPQVHGPDAGRPAYLDPCVEFVHADVRDRDAVRKALDGVDAVYHFAARVGAGQSMYLPADYSDVNTVGTAVLLEALADHPVSRLVVASSMSIYGEGRCDAPYNGGYVDPPQRPIEQLRAGQWELRAADGSMLRPIPTPEEKAPSLASVYALTKYDQERLCLIYGEAYGIPVVALRLFNVYGPRQTISNPYTGVLAIFASRLLNDRAPLIYEDGEQRRDFVSVHDVAAACLLALDAPGAPGLAMNIGGGGSWSVRAVAEHLARALGKAGIRPAITRKHRSGDIRHCFADVSLAGSVLGYEPRVGLEEGLAELTQWLCGQAPADGAERAAHDVADRELTV